MVGAWVAAGWAGIAYGAFLTITALRSPPGADLTGQWVAQPAFKASMALLLALAAAAHPVVRERRWLMLAAEMAGLANGSGRSAPDPVRAIRPGLPRVATRTLSADAGSVRGARFPGRIANADCGPATAL